MCSGGGILRERSRRDAFELLETPVTSASIGELLVPDALLVLDRWAFAIRDVYEFGGEGCVGEVVELLVDDFHWDGVAVLVQQYGSVWERPVSVVRDVELHPVAPVCGVVVIAGLLDAHVICDRHTSQCEIVAPCYVIEECSVVGGQLEWSVPVFQVEVFEQTTRKENARPSRRIIVVRPIAMLIAQHNLLRMIVLLHQMQQVLHMHVGIVHHTHKPLHLTKSLIAQPILKHERILAPQTNIVRALATSVLHMRNHTTITQIAILAI